jgi:hypothetical protein
MTADMPAPGHILRHRPQFVAELAKFYELDVAGKRSGIPLKDIR